MKNNYENNLHFIVSFVVFGSITFIFFGLILLRAYPKEYMENIWLLVTVVCISGLVAGTQTIKKKNLQKNFKPSWTGNYFIIQGIILLFASLPLILQ